MTSKWVRLVQSQRDYTVDWRVISLRLVNAEAGHTAGLRLLRVVHRALSEHGCEDVGALYEALGRHIFDSAN